MFVRTTDPAVVARAEELTLRAIDVDPTIGETFCTIGIIGFQYGEPRAAARAFQDALDRTPMLAEAHDYLGQLLAESGHLDEAIRRRAGGAARWRHRRFARRRRAHPRPAW